MVTIYVEGGGDAKALRVACRAGFSKFLSEAGLKGNMPKIVACGSRKNAYDWFCIEIKSGRDALLLVDSESPVSADYQQADNQKNWKPWLHLRNRQGDQWVKPENASDADCHLMVQCMEAWFLADSRSLQSFFGQGFNTNALPARGNKIESVAKEKIYDSLAAATKNRKPKEKYSKGKHSFQILERVSPEVVSDASPWAKRFIEIVKVKMGC